MSRVKWGCREGARWCKCRPVYSSVCLSDLINLSNCLCINASMYLYIDALNKLICISACLYTHAHAHVCTHCVALAPPWAGADHIFLHPYEGRSVGKFCTCIRCATIGSASGVMSTRRLRPKGEVWMEHAAHENVQRACKLHDSRELVPSQFCCL